MWIERFKQKLKQLGLNYQDASKAMSMTKNGFQSAMKNDTFSFKKVIMIADRYDFSLDELRFDEEIKLEECSVKYNENVKKLHSSHMEKLIPKYIYDDIKLNYENRIVDLKSQVEYLQHLINNDHRQDRKPA
jgi:hypothetical protein